MVSPTTITHIAKAEEDHDSNIHQCDNLKRSPSSTATATPPNNQTNKPHQRGRQTIPSTSLLLPSTLPTHMNPVTPSPTSPHDPVNSATFGSKATLSYTLPHRVTQHQPQPYRFQTPSYVFNTEQSNHLEQLKGSAGCNCKKSRYVYFHFILVFLKCSFSYIFIILFPCFNSQLFEVVLSMFRSLDDLWIEMSM